MKYIDTRKITINNSSGCTTTIPEPILRAFDYDGKYYQGICDNKFFISQEDFNGSIVKEFRTGINSNIICIPVAITKHLNLSDYKFFDLYLDNGDIFFIPTNSRD